MKLLLTTALYVTRALSLPASLSSAATSSALFSAIPTSAAAPTASTSALFSTIPTSVVPITTSTRVSVGSALPSSVFDDNENDDEDHHGMNKLAHPVMSGHHADNTVSGTHNMSSIHNQTVDSPSPQHHPHEISQKANQTAPYSNGTISSAPKNAANYGDDNENDADGPTMIDADTDEVSEGSNDDNDIESNGNGTMSPPSISTGGSSTNATNGKSTADLIPDSRVSARL